MSGKSDEHKNYKTVKLKRQAELSRLAPELREQRHYDLIKQIVFGSTLFRAAGGGRCDKGEGQGRNEATRQDSVDSETRRDCRGKDEGILSFKQGVYWFG